MSILMTILLGAVVLNDYDESAASETARSIVEIEDDGGAGKVDGVLPENAREQEKLVISAVRSDFDREDGLVMFEGNARIAYSAGFFMDADKLYVMFVGSNAVDRIIADGHVAISNENRLGRCNTAVFRKETGEVEMFGTATEPARLAETGADEIAGKRIKFWTDTEQVEIGGSEIIFEKGEGDSKQKKVFKKK